MAVQPLYLPTSRIHADSGQVARTPAELEMNLTYCEVSAVLAQHGQVCTERNEPTICQDCLLYRNLSPRLLH